MNPNDERPENMNLLGPLFQIFWSFVGKKWAGDCVNEHGRHLFMSGSVCGIRYVRSPIWYVSRCDSEAETRSILVPPNRTEG